MMLRKGCLIALCFGVLGACISELKATPTPALADSGYQPGLVGISPYGTVGWEFTPSSDVWVGELGFFDMDLDGLNRAHEIGIWDDSEQLLVSATVGTLGTLSGEYRYVSVQPILLQAGESFVIGATVPMSQMYSVYTLSSDDFYPSTSVEIVPGNIVSSPGIDLAHMNRFAEYDPYGPLTFPGQHKPSFTVPILPGVTSEPTTISYYFVAPNFTFTEVPEPTTSLLIGIGLLGTLLRRRAP